MAIPVMLYIRLRCSDGVFVSASIKHELPFIPSIHDEVAIYLPSLPEDWDEDAWDGRVGAVWIEVDGTVGINIDPSSVDCSDSSDDVVTDLLKAGWKASCNKRTTI